jgi:hypothetical protein
MKTTLLFNNIAFETNALSKSYSVISAQVTIFKNVLPSVAASHQ